MMIRLSESMLLILLILTGAAASAEPEELAVQKAKINLTGSVKIKARFPGGEVSPAFDPMVDGVEFSIGPLTLLSLPPIGERASLKEKKPHCWSFRDKDAKSRFVLDVRNGKFSFKGKKLDLARLDHEDAEGLTVTLVLGAVTFSQDVDFERRFDRFSYKAAGSDSWNFVPRVPPGWGSGDVGGGSPGPMTFRILASGSASLITTAQTRVARDWTEYGQLWVEHNGSMPPGVGAPDVGPPIVDFDKEIVVAVFLGTKPTSGFDVSILSVKALGSGAQVDYLEREVGPGCGAAAVITQPFVLAAITKVSGSVMFSGLSRVDDCP
jgi:hypothetical protein